MLSRCPSLPSPRASSDSPHAHSHPRKPAGRQAASMQARWATLAAASSPVCLPCSPAGIRVWLPLAVVLSSPRAGGRRRVVFPFWFVLSRCLHLVCFAAGAAGRLPSFCLFCLCCSYLAGARICLRKSCRGGLSPCPAQKKDATYTRRRPQYNMNTKNYCGVYVASS